MLTMLCVVASSACVVVACGVPSVDVCDAIVTYYFCPVVLVVRMCAVVLCCCSRGQLNQDCL